LHIVLFHRYWHCLVNKDPDFNAEQQIILPVCISTQ
jgi:hypothetical protein